MQLNSLYLGVTNMDRAVAFYAQVFQQPPAQHTERFSTFVVGDMRFGLLNAAFYSHPLVVGNNCVPTFEVADLDAEYARIKLLVSQITPGIQAVGRYRLFQYADPEGNVLELYSLQREATDA